MKPKPISLRKQLRIIIAAHATEQGTSYPSAMRDVLTDLRHLADQWNLNLGEIDSRAHEVYLEELELAKSK